MNGRMAKKLALVIVSVFTLMCMAGCGNADNEKRFEGEGYDNPEAALTAYIDALRSGSPADMISTFAIESYVECYDLEGYIKTYRHYDTSNEIGLPTEGSNEFVFEMNCLSRCSWLYRQVYNAYRYLIGMPMETQNMAFPRQDDEQLVEEFILSLTDEQFMEKIGKLEVVEILDIDDFELTEQDLENMARTESYRSNYIEYDELKMLAAKCRFDGRELYIFMTVMRIDGRWYNMTPNSDLGFWQGMDTAVGGLMFAEEMDEY